MKKIITLVLLFSSIVNSFAQETVTNKNGKEITVNTPAASSTQGQVKLTGDLGGTADAPTVPALTNKLEGTGTLNYIPKFTASKTLGNSLLFDNGTNIGIGTTAPANRLEISHGTAGNSGLRFTNLNSASTATTSSSKVLAVNSSGDVILTNVPGTQNIVAFSVNANPNTAGTTFSPNTPTDQSVVYQSNVDNSLWTYNGTTYVTYTAPPSTAWYTASTTNDAGSSKTSSIWRSGNVGIGMNNPTSPLEVQSTSNFTYVTTAKFLAPNNTGLGNTTLLNFGVSATTGNTADWRYVYQGNGSATNRVDFGMSGYTAPMLSYLNNGNVGIGTISPSIKLHVLNSTAAVQAANAAANMIRMSRPSTGGVKWDNIAQFNLGTYESTLGSPIDAKTRLDLALTNGGDNTTLSNVMTWLANGNVGINNTAPSSPLVVQGVVGTGNLKLIAPVVNTSGDNWWMGFGHGTTSTDANDRARIGVDILTGGSGRLFFTTGAPAAQTRAMFIDESQKVGIGTSVPTGQFEIATSNGLSSIIKRFGNTSQSAANLILQKTYGTDATSHGAGIISGDYIGRILFSASNGTSYLTNGTDIVGYAAGIQSATNNGGGIFFRTVPQNSVAQSVERMRIDENGNIGIGTSTPVSKLEVNGSATNTTAFNAAAGTTIDFSKSNLAYTTASPGSFTLNNLKDGGTYTLAVQGTTQGTAIFSGSNPSSTAFTFLSTNNGQTIAGKQTLYTFIVMGTSVYYYMEAGF